MPAVPVALPRLTHSPDLFAYRRRKTRVVQVGDVGVGGANPLRLQSMTTTRTQDTESTVNQAVRLVRSGCEIVRMTAPTEVDARNLKNIAAALRAKGIGVPLVADIHFRPEAALEAAEHVEKVRINPGNFTDAKAFKAREYTDAQYAEELARIEERFTPLVVKLKRLGRALRIGTNHGSLSDRILNRYGDTPEGMVESALEFVAICEKNGYRDIILSMKASNPKVMIAAYRLLAARLDAEGRDYPLHLGVTEAGDGEDGRIKSAIGMGSLLEDGLGDTLRVSLTEEPELEIPVARRLASPYTDRPPTAYLATPAIEGLCPVGDLFHYARRPAREIQVGPLRLGADHPVRVVTALDPAQASAPILLALLEQRLKSGRGLPPEIVEWPVANPRDLALLDRFREALRFETRRLGFLVRVKSAEEGTAALPKADGIVLAPEGLSQADALARAARAAGKPLWLLAREAEDLLTAARAAAVHQPDLVLALRNTDLSRLFHQARYVVAQPWIKEAGFPFHIVAPALQGNEGEILSAATLAGGLLTDGIGDSLSVPTGQGLERDLELTANILQGAGARISKAEFVSCPSCGRTLFDLQTTTERIKRRTDHLTNVKIAIMGCIVNGPGEMADADFGFVGGGPGKISLYVGKECVEKGIPFDQADDRLVELIKQHGKWRDPS